MIHIKIKANYPKIWAATFKMLDELANKQLKRLGKQTNKQKNGFMQITTIVKFHSRHYDLAQQENHRWTK